MAITKERVQEALDKGAEVNDVRSLMKTPGQLALVDDVAADREGFQEAPQVDVTEGFGLRNVEAEYEPMPMPEHVASRSAAFASVVANGDPLANYRQIKAELKQTGNSALLSTVEHIIATEEDEALRKAFEDLLVNTPDLKPEQVKAYVDLYEQMKGEVGERSKDYKEAFSEKMASSVNPTKPKDEQRTQINIWENLDKQINTDDKIRQMIAESAAKSNVELGNVLLEFGEAAVVPFAEGSFINQVARDVFGKDAKWWHHLLPGENTHKLKQAFMKLPPEQRIGYAEEVIAAAESNSGFLRDSNDFHKYQMLLKLLTTDGTQDDTDWDRIFDNAVGILDAAAVVTMGATLIPKALLRFGRIAMDSPADVLRNTNPEASRDLMRAASEDPDGLEVQQALGATKEDILLDHVMPLPDGSTVRVGPDLLSTLEPDSLMFTQADRAAKAQGLAEEYNKLKGAYLHPSKSTITANESENGFIVTARYGLSEDYGFPSIEDALFKAEALVDDISEVKLLQRDYTSNTYKVMSEEEVAMAKAFPEKSFGEYMFEIKQEHKLTPEDKLIFGSHSVFVGGVKNKYTSSPAARFGEDILHSAYRGFDNAKALEAHALNIIKEPFVKLGNNSKAKIIDLIEEGSRRERNFTINELISLRPDITQKEIEGYYAVRKFWDTLWYVQNMHLHGDMSRRGVKKIVNEDGDFVHAAKPLELGNAKQVEWAYDPVGKVVQKLTPEMIGRLYKRGGSIGTAEDVVRTPGHITNHLLIDPMFGTEVKGLPEHVLNYIPGYYTRIYKDPYFIEKTYTNVLVNGKKADKNNPHARTIMTAGTRAEAERIAARLNTGEPGVSYRVKHDRSITNQMERAQADSDIMSVQGRLFFSKRGEHLQDLDGRAITADPVEAMQRAAAAVSNRVGMQQWLETTKTTFLKSYGDILHGNKDQYGNPMFPGSRREIYNDKLATDPRVKEAQELFDYIKLMEGMEDPTSAHWRGLMVRLAEWIEGDGSSALRTTVSKAPLAARDINPMAKIRQVPFTLFLVANPIRQAALQSQQFAFLAGINPRQAFGSMTKDVPGLTMGMAIIDRPDMWKKLAPTAAKAMGMSVDEYKSFVNSFRNSGIPYTIDSHMFVQGMSFHPSFEVARTGRQHLKKIGTNAVSIPTNVLKSIGFDAGEFINMASTWSFARRQWIENNPGKNWKNKKAMDEIAATARDWSLAMTKPGSMGYQRGYLSLITQFVSIQHKAWEAFMPAKWGGSRAFTADQKRRMAIGNLLFYGASGFGLKEAYEWVRDEFELDMTGEAASLMEDFMLGGMFEIAVNKTMDALFREEGDEPANLVVSEDFAPAGGFYHTVVDMVGEAMMGDISLLEAAFGPSGSAMGRIGDALGVSKMIVQHQDLDNVEKFTMTMDQLGQVLSGYNNYAKARAMIKMGHVIDRRGNEIDKSTYAEAIARGLFGLRTYGEAEYWETKMDMAERRRKLDEISDTYYERTMQIVTHYREHGNYEHLQEALSTENLILSTMDDWEREYILERFRNRMLSARRDGVQTHVEGIVDAILRGEVDPESHWKGKLLHSDLFTDEQKDAAIQALDYLNEEAEDVRGEQ